MHPMLTVSTKYIYSLLDTLAIVEVTYEVHLWVGGATLINLQTATEL